MDPSESNLFEGTITAYIRSRCIGFQRREDGLAAVIESLVQPRDGALTLVYELRGADGTTECTLRRRPPIDIPAPHRMP